MESKMKCTEKQILKAIENSDGVISTIAKKLNVSWYTCQTYINSNEKLKRAFMDEKESILDEGESALITAVRNNEAWAISLLLKTLGKERGYTEKSIITNEDNLTKIIEEFSKIGKDV